MKKLFIFLLIAMCAVSCKNKTTNKLQPAEVKDEAPATAVKGNGKYAIKSGIVEYKSDMMGFPATQTLYFDNYGATESTVTVMDVMGIKTQTVTITKDGSVYNFDPTNKTGSKTPVMTSANINFEDLNDKVVKDWNLKKEGIETLLGKKCEKYSLDNRSMGMNGYYWVWKGIALKVDADLSTAKMLLEATRIQENVNIPAEKFAIPADIVFN